MAIRKIAYRGSKASRECVKCKYLFLYSDVEKAAAMKTKIKCPDCGTSMIIQFGGHGTVISTDTKSKRLLS